MKIYRTHLSCMQDMLRRSSGHVEVSLTEFGPEGFHVPPHVAFGKSQIWGSRRSPASSPSSFAIVDAAGYPLEMPPTLAPLVAALAVGLQCAGSLGSHGNGVREPHLRVARRLAIRREHMERRAMLLQQQENHIMAKAKAEKREPMRSYLPEDAGELLRPRVQNLGRSKFLAPVLRSSPTCQRASVCGSLTEPRSLLRISFRSGTQ